MSVGRVTQRSMSDVALRGLQGALGRTQDLQTELSSGRRISRPGDDPAGASSAMQLRSQRRADEQYLRNADDASGRLGTADKALQTLSERISKVQGLLLTSRNGALNDTSRAAIAQEIKAIQGDVVDTYNTRWLGRPVFGGTTPGEDAVVPVAVPAGTYAFVGDDAPVVARVSRDATIRTDVSGTAAGASTIPNLIGEIAEHVATNDPATSDDIAKLDAALTTVLRTIGDVGARAARVETTRGRVDSERLDFTSRISVHEEIDLPETMMKLQASQVAYQAALGAAAKVLQVSLADYLR